MYKCEKCNEYRFNYDGECHCSLFTVTSEHEEDHEVYAMDEEGAALKYAEKSNTDGDYYLMDGPVVIKVNGKPFEISAEPDVYYSANEI